jgi:hypothetical protein
MKSDGKTFAPARRRSETGRIGSAARALVASSGAGYSISPVAEIIAERGLPFFFVSGYGAAGRPEAYSDRPVLQKPLLMAKLGEAINSILSTGNVSARGA